MNAQRARHNLALTQGAIALKEVQMPMALLLVCGYRADIPSVQAVHKLADLGITGITVLGDEQTLALVLEGWAFDPARASDAAGVVLPTLRPLILETQFHVAVRCGPEGG